MSEDVFQPRAQDLPTNLPVFPLTGVLLLPSGRLPLNVFEPRYLNMCFDALAEGRMIGMIQPRAPDPHDNFGESEANAPPDLYAVGCAGRIAAFSEASGGRLLITLVGVSRFTVTGEGPTRRGYRRARVDFTGFHGDLLAPGGCLPDRRRLLDALRTYLTGRGMEVDWESLSEVSDPLLLTSLAMFCPFEPQEKQALLECWGMEALAETMVTILEMGGAGPGLGDAPTAH